MSGVIAPNDFNVGADCTLNITGAFGELVLQHITDFASRQRVKSPMVDPLNAPPIRNDLPAGWEFTFTVDRANLNVDAYADSMEQTFWNGGRIAKGTMIQRINEIDGSVSTWEWTDITMHSSNAGNWQSENPVRQQVNGFARRRMRVS